MEVFQDYAYYYSVFYSDKDYKTEAGQVDYLLKKYGFNIHKIINFGCGTGQHDIELTKAGYRCTGIDMSSYMIHSAVENAARQNLNIDFAVADIRKYECEVRFDAVISLFHVMSYQTGNGDILNALKSARKVLDRNGVLLFDVWYGPGVLSDKPCVRIKEIEDEKNRLIRIARPVMYDKRDVVDVNYEVLVISKMTGKVQMVHETHSMRYFFRPELEHLLHESGFELLDNLDCITLEETGYNSWTSYFVAKAV